jgi:succinyl-diaminopimelate desuccinylase
MPDLLDRTAELVDIRSESHGERAITDHIEALLRADAPWLALDRVGDNLVARTELGRPWRLIVAGHTDTVPLHDNWPSRREGDVLWGCGASDMKAGLATMIELARTVDSPAVDLTLVFYEAEEVAAVHNGLARLFRERPDLVVGDAALLGEPTGGAVEAGCQGTLRAELHLAGARAHTARPWMGRNAIHRLAGALERLAGYEGRRAVIDGCEYREAMQAVRVEGGVAGNVVPDEAVLVVNHRFAPDRDAEAAAAHVREVIGVDVCDGDRFAVTDMAPAAAPGLGHPLLTALIERNHLPVRAKLGWTDVSRFAENGVPAANFGPGDATLAHTPGEHVELEPIERVYGALVELVRGGVAP